MKEAIYVSVDIETNGPIPADNSMLSLGGAAFDQNGALISTFYANLEEVQGSSSNPGTMEWWGKNQEAYNQTQIDKQDPGSVMWRFVEWVESLGGKPVCVCYPAGF